MLQMAQVTEGEKVKEGKGTVQAVTANGALQLHSETKRLGFLNPEEITFLLQNYKTETTWEFTPLP